MKIPFPCEITELCALLSSPLYAVGGYVRGFLIDGRVADDLDLAGSMAAEEVALAAKRLGLPVKATYKRTGTVMFSVGNVKAEYTAMRRETYAAGGGHTPLAIEPTFSLTEDALRRDFTCNAVYYDIAAGKIEDPLGGVEDIAQKRLKTVRPPEDVFQSDGLRLMRLARQAGELGFAPTKDTLAGAAKYCANIDDISGERIWEELKRILVCDKKYPYSDPNGPQTAITLLKKTGVLKRIFPELFESANGEPDLGAFARAESRVKLAGLFVGGGADAAGAGLRRLRAPVKETEDACRLLTLLGADGGENESERRHFIAKNYDDLPRLFSLKKAVFAAKGGTGEPADVKALRRTLAAMKKACAPLSLKDLAVDGSDLAAIGLSGREIGETLAFLFDAALQNPALNDKRTLLRLAESRKKR